MDYIDVLIAKETVQLQLQSLSAVASVSSICSCKIHTFDATCDSERIYKRIVAKTASHAFRRIQAFLILNFSRCNFSHGKYILFTARAHQCVFIACSANANEWNSIESAQSQVAHKCE